MLLLFSGQSGYLALNKKTDFQGVYLATLSADSSSIVVSQRTAPFGGVGKTNMKPVSNDIANGWWDSSHDLPDHQAGSSWATQRVINHDGTAATTQDWLPDGNTYARVLGTALSSGLVHLPTGVVGNIPHANQSDEYQANFDPSGNALASTLLRTYVPNSTAATTDATIEWSWTGTGPYSVSIWYDNGTAGQDSTYIFPDGTSANIGHTTSSSPAFQASGVAANTNYYAVLHHKNGTTTLDIQTSPFSITQQAAYVADGGIVPASSHASTPMFTASGSGGSGGYSGGGTGRHL